MKAVTSVVQHKKIVDVFRDGRESQDINSTAEDDEEEEEEDYLGPLEVPMDSDDGSWHSSDDDIEL